jgi:pilus assembly protein CpaE
MMAARATAQRPRGAAAAAQFVAMVSDEVTRETVRTVAVHLGWNSLNVRIGGADDALDYIQANAAPAFLLVDISDSDDATRAMRSIAGLCGGETKIVAIGLANDVALYRRLIEMGVSDYMVKPVSGQALVDTIQHAVHGEQFGSGPARSARIVAMIGARGGVGASTLAVSSAWTMAEDRRLRVVLLDLDLHFGSLALSLDMEPGRGLREILTSPDRIDSLLIGSAMSSPTERLRVLGAEEPLEDSIDVGYDGLTALLADLAASNDIIVVDVPRSLNGLSRHVLSVADLVAVVTDRSLPGMRDTQRLLTLVRNMRGDAKTLVVANRVGGVAGEVGQPDFERGIGAKIAFSVPFDAKAAIAAAQGAKALIEVARNGKTVDELHNLAAGLAGGAEQPKPSLLKRLIGK